MNNQQSIFIKRLTQLMEEFNITQIQLAQKADITNVTISRYLSGERKPRIEIITKIANVFSVSTDYLLGLSDERTPQKFDEDFTSFYEIYAELEGDDQEILKAMLKALKNKKKK